MTRAQLRTAIKTESRIFKSTDLDGFVDSVVDDILTDACNKVRYFELFVPDVTIILVDATGQYSLPTDFQNIKELRYGVGPLPLNATTPNKFATLQIPNDNVRRTYTQGVPFFYFLSGANKVNVFPFRDLKSTDTLLVSYYKDPLSVFAVDGDVFPIPRILPMVKKMAIARVQRFHNADQPATMTQQDSNNSFVSATSGTPQ